MLKKTNRNTYDISNTKRVTRTFLEVSLCSRAKQRQRNVQKSVLHVKIDFLLIRLIAVSCRSRCLRRLALHDFILCLSEM